MGLIVRVLLVFMFAISISIESNAAWQGPTEIISGTWGSGVGQFGLEYGDSGDGFPEIEAIIPEGKIVISDTVNKKQLVFNADGSLFKEVNWPITSQGGGRTSYSVPEFSFETILGYRSDGNIYTGAGNKYFLKNSTGQLLQTFTEKPAELGKVKSSNLGQNKYKITVTYPDRVYGFTSDRKFTRYIRDSTGFVYGLNAGGAWRFNQCGKLMGSALMPSDQRHETARSGGGENIVTVNEEYGQPVISFNGDVYTWKRTPDAYSILKWTWTDDPNAPANAPDAPENLSIKIVSAGINLFWKAVAQDPGCVTGYELVRATTSGGSYTSLATVGAGTANATGWIKYTDTTAEIGRTYYYKVRAAAGTEYSSYTAEVSGKR